MIPSASCTHVGTCCLQRCRGGCETDLIQFGGSSDLETAHLDASESLCSCHARRYIRRVRCNTQRRK